jgi:hypothetical protein
MMESKPRAVALVSPFTIYNVYMALTTEPWKDVLTMTGGAFGGEGGRDARVAFTRYPPYIEPGEAGWKPATKAPKNAGRFPRPMLQTDLIPIALWLQVAHGIAISEPDEMRLLEQVIEFIARQNPSLPVLQP